MSTDLYQTALVWHGQRGGVAKLWGRSVPLVDTPALLDLRLVVVELCTASQFEALIV